MNGREALRQGRLLWALLFAGASLLLVWVMQLQVFYWWPPLLGSDPWGLAYGIAGTALILVSAAYSARKVRLDWWAGSLELWLKLHVYLGALALLLIVAHSGYRLHATVPNLALLFLFLTVVSGMAGWAIFGWLPRRKAAALTHPVLPELTAKRLTEIHEHLAALCSDKPRHFLDLYNEVAVPLYRSRGRQPAAIEREAPPDSQFEFGEEEEFERAVELCREAQRLFRDLERHLRFLRWLRGWLYVHVPLSVGLLVFTAAHIAGVLRYWW